MNRENILIISKFLGYKDILELRKIKEYVFTEYVKYNEISFDTEIEDEDLYVLKKYDIRKINLSYCTNITNEGLKIISNTKYNINNSINLALCRNITDRGLKYLSNFRYIDLHGCNNITERGLLYLINCVRINLKNCKGISKSFSLENKNLKIKIKI